MTHPATKRFRPSAKAVVLSEGRLLVTRNNTPGDGRGDWFILPGGGQLLGETLEDALRREVREETGYEVLPGRLLWVRELIVALRPDWPFDPGDHAIEFMFESQVVGRGEPVEADEYQIGVEWVTTTRLGEIRFYPQALVGRLQALSAGGDPGPPYLGDVD